MIQGTSRNSNNFNYDGTIGQKPTSLSQSITLSQEQEQVLLDIKNKLDLKLSELAQSLEEITVEISSLIGVKNTNNDPINPATEETAISISNKIDLLSSTITNLIQNLKGANNKDLSTIQTKIEETISVLYSLSSVISTEQTTSQIKTNTDKLDISLSQFRDYLRGSGLKDLTTLQAKVEDILSKLDIELSSRASEYTLNSIKDYTSNLNISLSSLRDSLKGSGNSDLTILQTKIENIIALLDVTLSSRASEYTLSQIKAKTDNLDIALSNLLSSLKGAQNKDLSTIETVLNNIFTKLFDVNIASSALPTGAATEATLQTRLSENAFNTKFNGNNLLGIIKERPNFTEYTGTTSGWDSLVYGPYNLANKASTTINITIPNNEKWHIQNFNGMRQIIGGNGETCSTFQLIWDPTGVNKNLSILMCNDSSAITNVNYAVTGNGTKVLRIIITNGNAGTTNHYTVLSVYREVL